jgi:hypothetical protein
MAHDITALESKLRNLDQSFNKLTAAKLAQQLVDIIHRPGWTTLPEIMLVNAMVDHMQHQIDGLARAHENLLTAAQKVGTSLS